MEARHGKTSLTVENIPYELRVYDIVTCVAYLAGVSQGEFGNLQQRLHI